LNKWIWIDPLFALLAKNQYGEYLSLMEIRQTYYKDEKVVYEFFGNDYHYLKNNDPCKHDYFDNKQDFSDIMVTWGNNIFEEDRFNRDLEFLPKALRQFIGLLIGVLPSYVVYEDNDSIRANSLQKSKYITLSLFGLLACGTLLHPFCATIGLWNRGKRWRWEFFTYYR
jgi:hypothetical protein